MALRRHVLIAMAVAASISLGGPASAQNGDKFTARLGWVPTSGAERAGVAGKGTATATLSARTLAITGTFDGLVAPATAARLHHGVAKGARGSAISELTITKATSGAISGSVTLNAEQLESLKQGKVYVQIHSERGVAPDGSNLWGWFLR